MSIGVSLGAALLVNSKVAKFRSVFRTVYFAPVVTTLVAVAVVWRYIFHTRYGFLNYALASIGIDPIDWMGNPHWAMPAIVILAWLVLRGRSRGRDALRAPFVFLVSGATTAGVLLIPMLWAAGPRMIQMVIFAQLGRTGAFSTGRVQRIRLLEGFPPHSRLEHLVPEVVVILAFVAAVALIGLVAWKRREIRLWAAVLAGQIAFLMITPVFFPHYGGWIAPQVALCVGTTAATIIDWLGPNRGRWARGVFALGLAVLLVVSGRPTGKRVPLTPSDPDLSAARCVTADAPIMLITTETLRRSLTNGCDLLLNPNSVSHVINAERGDNELPRLKLPEYQRQMQEYYGSSDAVIIGRPNKAALSPETWAAIKARLPIELHRGKITILLAEQP